MRKVGVDFIPTTKRKRRISYKDIKDEYDEDGWMDANKYMPGNYDLMFLKVKDKGILSGWAIGKSWDGLTIKPDDEVIAWKRKSEE